MGPALAVLSVGAVLVVAIIGMSGDGPLWMRYVGSVTILVLLLCILATVMQISNRMDGEPDDECEEEVDSEGAVLVEDAQHEHEPYGDSWPRN